MPSQPALFTTFLIALLGLCLAAGGIYCCLALHDIPTGAFCIVMAIAVFVALSIVQRGQKRLDALGLQLLEESNRALLQMRSQDKQS